MRVKDLINACDSKVLFPPIAAVTDNTAQVSNIIDCRNTEMVAMFLALGTESDADMTTVVLLEEGDDSALSDAAAVDDADMIGTELLAAFTFASDNKTRKLGYIGSKAYIRMTVTPSNNSGNIYLAGVALRVLKTQPASNPPT